MKKMQLQILLARPAYRAAFFAAICCLYIPIQMLALYLAKTEAVFALGIIPLVAAAWLLGYRATIIMGSALWALQLLFIHLALPPLSTGDIVIGSGVSILMVAIALIVSRLSSLSRTVRWQLQQMEDAEREKSELLQQLHQSQKMEALGQLAGGIAHDFNNLLGAIAGYAELIQTNCAQNELNANYAAGIRKAAGRAADMTVNLLTFARRGRFEMIPTDLHAVITGVVEMITHTFDKRISIVQRLCEGSVMVIGDHTQLQNSILNLAINSRDAMPGGGELIISTSRVEIGGEFMKARSFTIRKGHYARLSVIDTGLGMDAQTAARAFEPFFTTKRQGKGTGLGLSSVFGAIKGHGGFVELHSKLGKGTTVDIYLPLASDGEYAETPEIAGLAKDDNSGNVLIVDDEPLVRDVMAEMLKNLGYAVKACEDAQEAIEYYREHRQEVSFVLLDILMPVMGGYECFVELQKIDPTVKAIVVSGYANEGDAEKIVKKGARGFVKKPFTRKILSDTIVKALDS